MCLAGKRRMKKSAQQISNEGSLLTGKVAIVTGGGAGIGEAICKRFAQHGAKVVVNGLPGDKVEDVVKEIHEAGGMAAPFVGDVATQVGARGCVQFAITTFGKLDVLVCNAALMGKNIALEETETEHFDELANNMRAVFQPVRAAIPELKKSKGVILTASSEAAIKGIPDNALYSASKGWISSFSHACANALARYGIRVNTVAPGPIETEMTRPGDIKGKVTMGMGVREVPLGRRGTPEEVANVFLFLASDLATFVTSSVYRVDGGSVHSAGMLGLLGESEAPEGSVVLEHQHEGRGTREKRS
jgi:NAD(P)-dependent dehydrogenase (short-subunit alcohol dehydrogenase family)